MGGRAGDLLVLVGIVLLVLLARRKGKASAAAALAAAYASGYAEGGNAVASAVANQSVAVNVGGQQLANGIDSDEVARYLAIIRADERLRGVRVGSDDSGGRLGRVPDVLHERSTTLGELSSVLDTRPVVVRNGHVDDSPATMNGYED